MDPIAQWRRFGLPHGSGISDELLVEHAGPSDPDSARYILQRCYQRLAKVASTNTQVRLLNVLDIMAFTEDSAYVLDDVDLKMGVSEIVSAVVENRNEFGNTLSDYLLERLEVLRGTDTPPLSAAFHLRMARGTGRTTLTERKFEIAERVKKIKDDLKRGRLRERALRVLASDALELFPSIEIHLRVTGYRSHEISGFRQELATRIDEITSEYGKNVETAARIFIECAKIRQALLLSILDSELVAPTAKTLLQEQIKQLDSFVNGGTGPSAIVAVYKSHGKRLPEELRGTCRTRTTGESAVLLAENHPAVTKALDIINSPDVGNHNRPALQKLQKQTPDEHQHIWRDLWDRFATNGLARAKSSEAKP